MESCATHMTHLDVEELLTLTVLAFFFSKTRSASFFFSNTPTQPHASLSQPQPSFFEQTHTGKRIRYTWIAPLSLSPQTPQTRVSTSLLKHTEPSLMPLSHLLHLCFLRNSDRQDVVRRNRRRPRAATADLTGQLDSPYLLTNLTEQQQPPIL